MRLFFVIFLLFILPREGFGQTVTVRSGEHDGFTRLALDLPRKVDWKMSGEDIKTITFEGLTPTYDLTSVMPRLSAGRVISVGLANDPYALSVSLNCDCEVKSFFAGSAMLVIDFYGPPRETPAPAPAQTLGSETAQPSAAFKLPLVFPNPQQTSSTPRSETLAHTESAATLQTQIKRAERSRMVERDLLQEMSRVASQGLVSPQTKTSPIQEKATQPRDEPPQTVTADPLPPAPAGQNMRAFSSVDRDILMSQDRKTLNRDGQKCMADDKLALQNWVTDEGFTGHTGRLRAHIFGEFDKPEPEVVVELAKAYIGYGLGLEAVQVLTEIAMPETDRHLLALADIMEDGVLTQDKPDGWYLDCETAAALWALLAGDQTRSDMPLNSQSFLRSFSALPLHIRAHLGPFVSERLQDIGEDALLKDIARHMGRGQPDGLVAVALVSAHAEISAGEPDRATKELEKVIIANGENAPQALIEKINLQVAAGQTISQSDSDLLDAFALEYRQDPLGVEMARAALMARAATGRFEQSFTKLVALAPQLPQPELVQAASFVLDRLSQAADDLTFLELAFSPDVEKLRFASEAEHSAAARLIDLGFEGRALVFLSSAADQPSERSRKMIRAKAALGLGNTRQAEAELLGLDGPDIEALRADIKVKQEDYRAAQIVLETLGNTEAAAEQAWLADDRSGLTELAADEWQTEQALLQLNPLPDRDTNLANSQDLLRETEELRGLVTGVLARHKVDRQAEVQR